MASKKDYHDALEAVRGAFERAALKLSSAKIGMNDAAADAGTSAEEYRAQLAPRIHGVVATAIADAQAQHAQLLALLADEGGGSNTLSPQASEAENSSGMAPFISEIANALVSAQQSLDQRSMDYRAAAAGQPGLPPAVFRIPKLSAQFNFTFSKSQGESLNVLFVKRKESERETMEQSIALDIVAVPPDPATAGPAGAGVLPVVGVVVGEQQRAQLLALLKKVSSAKTAPLEADWPGTVIVPAPKPGGEPAPTSPSTYLLFYVEQLPTTKPKEQAKLRLWSFRLNVTDPEAPKLEEGSPTTPRTRARAVTAAFFADLTAWQRRVFAERGSGE